MNGEGAHSVQDPDWWAWIWTHISPYLPPVWVWWIVGGACCVVATWLLTRKLLRTSGKAWTAGRAYLSSRSIEDVLTVVAASIATGVSAQGMWRFAEDVLHLPFVLRILLFAFIEVAIVTSAVRARRNMRENFSAGVDGMAVWALTVLTAVLSSMDARSLPEAVFRLAAPLVAAWLWERGMAIERHRIRGTGRINWRLTPERIMVWAGVAEARDRTTSEVDAHRRITRVALAAKRVHQLRQAGVSDRKLARAVARRDRMLDRAVEHTGLARDASTQSALLDMVTTLGGGDDLSRKLDTASPPWAHLDHPAVTGNARHAEAVELAAALRDHTEALKERGDAELTATIVSLATYVAGRDGLPAPVLSPGPFSAAERGDVRPADGAPAVGPDRPQPVLELAPETDAHGAEEGQTEDSGEDNDTDRSKPTEQDNQAAEEWIRRRCRGQNGVGQKPSPADVRERHGFSHGWARRRITQVQSRMLSQGYVFEDNGLVLSPARASESVDAAERGEVPA
jgi:hypothetical protein